MRKIRDCYSKNMFWNQKWNQKGGIFLMKSYVGINISGKDSKDYTSEILSRRDISNISIKKI